MIDIGVFLGSEGLSIIQNVRDFLVVINIRLPTR